MRLRVLLGSLLIALICGSAQATAPAPLPVLALTGGGLGAASHVLALDPRTLEPEGSDLVVPGWAFGVEWARSPDGSQMALVPKPSETDERLVVVSSRPPLHVRVRLPLAGQDVCRLVWPSPRRLLAVATRGPACYSPIDGARLLVIDPTDGRIVSQRALTGPGTVVAAAPSPAGLLLLLKPEASSALQLLVVDSTRTKTFVIPGVRSPAGPLNKAVGSTLGLSVDATRRHAYVVEPSGRISDVDLRSGAVTLHEPAARATSAVTKGIAAMAVQALSPAPDSSSTVASAAPPTAASYRLASTSSTLAPGTHACSTGRQQASATPPPRFSPTSPSSNNSAARSREPDCTPTARAADRAYTPSPTNRSI